MSEREKIVGSITQLSLNILGVIIIYHGGHVGGWAGVLWAVVGATLATVKAKYIDDGKLLKVSINFSADEDGGN